MEVVEVVKELVNSVGFPIAACAVMFYQNHTLQKTLTDVQLAMQRIADKLGMNDEDN